MPNLNFADYKALTGDNTVTGWVIYNWISTSTPSPELPYNKTYNFSNETDTNNFIDSLSLWSRYESKTKNYYRNTNQQIAFDSEIGGLFVNGIRNNIRAGLYFSFKPNQLTNNVTVEIDMRNGVTSDLLLDSKQTVLSLFNSFNDGDIDGPRLNLTYDPTRTEGKFYWSWRKFNTDGNYEDIEFANTNSSYEDNVWKFNYDFDNQIITVFKDNVEVVVDNTSCGALNLRSYNLLNNSFGNNTQVRQKAYEYIRSVSFTEVNPNQ